MGRCHLGGRGPDGRAPPPLEVTIRRPLASLVVAVFAVACGAPEERPGPEPVADPVPQVVPSPTLPRGADRFAPTRVIADVAEATSGAHLADIEACSSCHEAAHEMWSTSAHAFASFSNPVYRTAIENLKKEVDGPTSRFCGGCHDVALLVDGVLEGVVEPADERAHAGVSCRMCHGIDRVTGDGNGSYRLRADAIPLPDTADKASVERHKQAVSRSTLGATLCASCHKAFLDIDTGNPHFLPGQTEVTVWRSSPYAGNGLARVDESIEKADCIDCHMRPEKIVGDDPAADADGMLASHRFLGAHTWLAAMRGDRAQQARVTAFLTGAASLDIAAVEGDLVSVVIRNLRVGHQFPAGVRDAQDIWIELELRDARGRLVAEAGGQHAASGADPTAHVLRSLVADENGQPVLDRRTHTFRAPIFDHTLAPRDSVVVRYRLPDAALADRPLTVTARLRHRSRNLSLQRMACTASRTAVGRAFAAGSEQHRGVALDPCPAQPIIEIARDVATLGAGFADSPDPRPRWRRLYEYGAALAHSVQEDLDQAHRPLQAALAELDAADEQGWPRAAVLVALAGVVGRQGRTDESLALLDRAALAAPGHPAIDRARATALTRVWRWQEAIEPLRRATAAAPGHVQAWSELAIALGSVGRDADALQAARAGLALSSRNGALLRVQALSLKALGADFAAALAAYDRYRPADVTPHLRIECARQSADCARERLPVHVHEMRAGPALR